ncbi:hypothetical protein FE257_006094, partial [Aspergillus nanangensis]
MAALPLLLVSVDFGTTTVATAWKWSGSEEEKNLLKFEADDYRKSSDELSANFARSKDAWLFGASATVSPDTVRFSNVKLAISGRSRDHVNNLRNSFASVSQEWAVEENPTTLLTS